MYFIILSFYFICFTIRHGKDIGRIYKHSQPRLSNLSLKTPVSSSSEPQTSSAIELTTKYIPYVTDKNQNNSVLYSQNTIHNDVTITYNDNIQSYETPKMIISFQPIQHLIIIHNVLLPYPQVD